MSTIITLSQEEIESNFDFALKLCAKGHTIKVITKLIWFDELVWRNH